MHCFFHIFLQALQTMAHLTVPDLHVLMDTSIPVLFHMVQFFLLMHFADNMDGIVPNCRSYLIQSCETETLYFFAIAMTSLFLNIFP